MLRLASIAMSGRRVLAVESEFDTAASMANDIMLSGGTIVGAVPGVPAALALLETGLRIDCIMMDTREVDAASDDLVRLRKAGIDVIFVTGYDDWFDDEEALEDDLIAIRA